MTAAEIRAIAERNVTGRIDGSMPEDSLSAFFLAEIAAQLAEMNAHANPVGDLYVGRIAGERFDASYKQLLDAGNAITRAIQANDDRWGLAWRQPFDGDDKLQAAIAFWQKEFSKG